MTMTEIMYQIQTIWGRIIVNPNRFVQAAAISLVLITFQCNAFLQTSRPSSIETIKNELSNVLIFKATMDNMDLIITNSDDISINLVNPIIPAGETSQKDNPQLVEAMRVDSCKNFMKAMGKK